MRFSTIVALYAAGVAASVKPEEPVEDKKGGHGPGKGHGKLTTSTVYATKTYTVSDCPDTVTKCGHGKTKVVTETVAVSTTVCPVDETETSKPKPTKPEETDKPKPTHPPKGESPEKPTHPPKGESPEKPPKGESPEKPEKPEKPACPSTTVKTIVSSYTTVLPTTISITETIDCPAKPTGVAKPTGGNSSSPAKPTKPVTAGAGSLIGSAAFAVVAGLAAFAFA